MLNWLTGLLNYITGPFRAVWNDVVRVVRSVYTYVKKYADYIYHDALSIYDGLITLSRDVAHFVDHTYDTFVRWVDHEFNTVVSWARSALNDLLRYAKSVYGFTVRELDKLDHFIASGLNDITSWVLRVIWDPLNRDITSAIRWIAKEGTYAYDLLTHPEKLIDIIIGYVWSAWLSLARRYAAPLLKLFLSSWKAAIPDVVGILEDIIAKVLLRRRNNGRSP